MKCFLSFHLNVKSMKVVLLFITFLSFTNSRKNVFLWDKLQRYEKSFIKDLWGYNVNWTNTDDGWNSEKRDLFIKLKSKILEQTHQFPMYSKYGYKKMKIPRALFDKIIDLKSNETLIPEVCQVPNPFNNCYRLKTVFGVPFLNGSMNIIGKSQKTNSTRPSPAL